MLNYCYVEEVLIFNKYAYLKITDYLHQSLHIQYLSPQEAFKKLPYTEPQKCSHLWSWSELLLIQYSVITTRRATSINLRVFGKRTMDFCMLAIPEDTHIFIGFTETTMQSQQNTFPFCPLEGQKPPWQNMPEYKQPGSWAISYLIFRCSLALPLSACRDRYVTTKGHGKVFPARLARFTGKADLCLLRCSVLCPRHGGLFWSALCRPVLRPASLRGTRPGTWAGSRLRTDSGQRHSASRAGQRPSLEPSPELSIWVWLPEL